MSRRAERSALRVGSPGSTARSAVRNTPISEAAITGLAAGAALCGLRPVLEIMFIDFTTLALDCLVNQCAKYRYMSGGLTRCTDGGTHAGGRGRRRGGPTLPEPGSLVHSRAGPGGSCAVIPRGGLRLAEKRHPVGRPCSVYRTQRLYTLREELPANTELPQIGKARIARTGTDVTLITYSAMVHNALAAADELARAGISVEVIDLRTLVPLDMATIATSVTKTHRVVVAHEAVRNGGVGAEIAARIGTELFDELDAPVIRLGCPFAPIPFAPELEQALLPGTADIVQAVHDSSA